MRELHEQMTRGKFEELNTYYSKDFMGYLFIPGSGEVEQMNYEAITKGNSNAASSIRGKRFNLSTLN